MPRKSRAIRQIENVQGSYKFKQDSGAGLIEEQSKEKLEEPEGVTRADIWWKSFSKRGKQQCKSPKARTGLVFLRNSWNRMNKRNSR